MDTLRSVSSGRTTIVIAHRLSTIQHADYIIVLEDGKVAEQGSPGELKRKADGLYSRMLEEQSQKEDVVDGE
jgi:ABC-type multidrug transport system fused ATPase/permease subunit